MKKRDRIIKVLDQIATEVAIILIGGAIAALILTTIISYFSRY
jgi:hypothetical protein